MLKHISMLLLTSYYPNTPLDLPTTICYDTRVVKGDPHEQHQKALPPGHGQPPDIWGRMGSSKWGIIDRETRQCLGVYPNETCAYDARRAILRHAGYDA